MSSAMRWITRVFLGSMVSFSSLAGSAWADVAPPPGQKYVQYGFRVDNIASFPEWVLVAYPCNASNGVPYKAGTAITTDAVVSVGRRGGTCAIYSMKKSEWTTWRAANPAPATLDNDPALEQLASSGQMLRCEGGPQPKFQVASSAPDTITDTVHIQVLTDTACQLVVNAPEEPPTIGLHCSVQQPVHASGRTAMWSLACVALGLGVARRRRARRG